MSDLRVTSLRGRKLGTVPTLPDGAVVTGVTTSTSFSGNVTGNVTGNVIGDSNITGTTGTFTGNVSVGGTLTYDDVTDIDSVGVVTARAGIKIGAGQSVSAVSGIVTYYGDGSKLSGVDHGVVNFVASGTIPNGKTVVVNTDGTVSTITSTVDSIGTAVVFESAAVQNLGATFDSSNNKVVIVYQDAGNSQHGTAVVGTVSGTSISFGTPVVFESASTSFISAAYDSNSGKVVIAYRDSANNEYGTAIVGTVSGTSISFGTAVVFNTGSTDAGTSIVFDSNSNKVVIAYRDTSNSSHGTSIVGTVSGTSISFGSEVVYNASTTNDSVAVFDSTNGKVVIAYKDGGNSSHGTAIVGTVSGTSISFGSEVVYNAGSTSHIAAVFDSTNGKVVISYRDDADSGKGKSIVGTVSGTSISFGSEVEFKGTGVYRVASAYDSTNGKVVIAYADDANSSRGTSIVGTISGTSISFGSEIIFETGTVGTTPVVTFDSTNGKVVIVYRDENNSNYGAALIFSVGASNLTAENYIGMSAEAIANGATGRINVLTGTNTGQTGLTTAQKYFVQPNGTLGTSAGSPSVVAGTAISGTKIVVR